MTVKELLQKEYPELSEKIDKFPTMLEAYNAKAITEHEAWLISRLALAHFAHESLELAPAQPTVIENSSMPMS